MLHVHSGVYEIVILIFLKKQQQIKQMYLEGHQNAKKKGGERETERERTNERNYRIQYIIIWILKLSKYRVPNWTPKCSVLKAFWWYVGQLNPILEDSVKKRTSL